MNAISWGKLKGYLTISFSKRRTKFKAFKGSPISLQINLNKNQTAFPKTLNKILKTSAKLKFLGEEKTNLWPKLQLTLL